MLLFGYILDLNSWLDNKKECALMNQKVMALKRFCLAVAHTLNQVNKPVSRVG